MATRAKPAGGLRADFVPAEYYRAPDVSVREREYLWPRVWQMVCREEELPTIGSFVAYEILDDSILVVRTGEGRDDVVAYYNVCQHRGRRLTEETHGQLGRTIVCRFHGWQWKIDGALHSVYDRENYAGCPHFQDKDLALPKVKIDRWGGWIWINQDEKAKSLKSWLGDVPKYVDPFSPETMRRHRWTTLTLPVNWKVVQEAFNEGYHIGQTHESGVNYRPAKTPSRAHGMHAMLVMEYTGFGEYKTASGKWKMPENTQEFIWASSQHLYKSLTGLVNEPGAVAAQRLLDLPADIAPEAALHYLRQFHREEYEKRGAPLPETLTPEAEAAGGVDWHIFPNSIFLPAVDGGIWYRSRPNGNDPDSCIFDIWWFGRYAPGAEPAVQQEVFHGFEAFRGQCEFLEEDFKNLGAVAKGMKSRGWKGARTNPVTEVPVNNFHKVLRRFLFPDEQSPKKLLRRSKKKTAKNRR